MGEILPNFVCWFFDCQSALHNRKSKSDPIGNSWPQSGLKRHQISESFIIAELTHPPEIKCNTLAALFNSSFGLVQTLYLMLALKRVIFLYHSQLILSWELKETYIGTRICHICIGILKCKVCKSMLYRRDDIFTNITFEFLWQHFIIPRMNLHSFIPLIKSLTFQQTVTWISWENILFEKCLTNDKILHFMDVLYIIYDSTYFKSNEIDTIESCTYGSTQFNFKGNKPHSFPNTCVCLIFSTNQKIS